ncbi:hypothetical protein E2C01_036415 [Portunus trituberculatus]|uniref:Uncharacterized protein n=1 Tax=Portunus trituberculatus TaxID=210409 RepID=A0A5B7FE46_PORTR|nr:hypothetical protein [Portunus trituberculatus]
MTCSYTLYTSPNHSHELSGVSLPITRQIRIPAIACLRKHSDSSRRRSKEGDVKVKGAGAAEDTFPPARHAGRRRYGPTDEGVAIAVMGQNGYCSVVRILLPLS